MKTKKSIIVTLWIALAILVWSCDENSESINPENENLVAENLLVNSNSALSRLRGNGIGGPMGAIYGNFQNGRKGRVAKSPSAMFRSGRISADGTNTTPSCLTEIWEDDGNGNYTYTLDFGDGCDYCGEWLKGKLVEKGPYNENCFSSSATFTNFGSHDWTIDGTHAYSGTWGEVVETSNPADTASYSASYQFSADLRTSYVEYGHDSTEEVSIGQRLIEVDYIAQGSEKVDQDGYTVQSRSESISISSGETFNSQVDIPLYYDFECDAEGTWIYVSGQESGSYSIGDQTGSYTINYGDGTCDNIVTVTENGVSEDVDLGKVWNEWEGECGNS